MSFLIGFKHFNIQVTCKEVEVLKKIEDEFFFFRSDSQDFISYRVDLIKDAPPQIPPSIALKILPHALIYEIHNAQYIDYHGKALIKRIGNFISIYSNDLDFLYELGFLTIHSSLGDLLNDLGLHRIHALAGTYNNKDFILMLPSGGGKSTLLLNLLKIPDFQIISDDSPLIDKYGHLHPFPSKISLIQKPDDEFQWTEFKRALHPPKFVLSFRQLNHRINCSPKDSTPILIKGLRASSPQPQIYAIGKCEAFSSLMENMIIGIGLPQVIEIFLKFNYLKDLTKMLSHFTKRSFSAIRLLRRSRNFGFVLSTDHNANVKALREFLDKESFKQ